MCRYLPPIVTAFDDDMTWFILLELAAKRGSPVTPKILAGLDVSTRPGTPEALLAADYPESSELSAAAEKRLGCLLITGS